MRLIYLFLFFIVLVIGYQSCNSPFVSYKKHTKKNTQYPLLAYKGYCMEDEFTNYDFYYGQLTYEKGSYRDPKIEEYYPFTFKADSVLFEKDSLIIFFGKNIEFKKIRIKTKFSYQEQTGYAGAFGSIDKFKYAIPVFMTREIDTVLYQQIIKDMLENDEGPLIEVLIKGNYRVFRVIGEAYTAYVTEHSAIVVYRSSLPKSNSEISCGIFMTGEHYLYKGMCIGGVTTPLILPEEKEHCLLNRADVLKLYGK